jgi:hypothetical protein
MFCRFLWDKGQAARQEVARLQDVEQEARAAAKGSIWSRFGRASKRPFRVDSISIKEFERHGTPPNWNGSGPRRCAGAASPKKSQLAMMSQLHSSACLSALMCYHGMRNAE